mgnify:FL=1
MVRSRFWFVKGHIVENWFFVDVGVSVLRALMFSPLCRNLLWYRPHGHSKCCAEASVRRLQAHYDLGLSRRHALPIRFHTWASRCILDLQRCVNLTDQELFSRYPGR